MTVNTNGVKVDLPPFTPRTMEERMNDWEEMLAATRDSQLRTEKLVDDFIEAASKNPMFKMLASKFGG